MSNLKIQIDVIIKVGAFEHMYALYNSGICFKRDLNRGVSTNFHPKATQCIFCFFAF